MRRLIIALAVCIGFLHSVTYSFSAATGPIKPLTQVVKPDVGEVKTSGDMPLPIITWGGDIATILANGGSAVTSADSIFGRKGLKLKLTRMDDFPKQVAQYLKGDMPYLRGTLSMINMASEALNRDPRTAPVVIYQHTWSVGGDCLVVKDDIKSVKDLQGKTIALQAYGPHIDYMGTLLRSAGLSVKDVKIIWTEEITGGDNTPGKAFQSGQADAAFVIIPDGLALTSGGNVGSGSEGSVKGAKILLSTKTANRIIADVYAVRSDYFQANKTKVQDFVHGLLLAEQQLKMQKDKDPAAFKKTLTAAATILLDSPQALADAESLYGDCEYVGFAGNMSFFGDPDQPRGFAKLNKEIQSTLISLGLLGRERLPAQAQWDYDRFRAGLTGIDTVPTARFKAEDVARVVEKKRQIGTLQEGELFSFEIYFKPNQNTFSADTYQTDFDKVIELASTYGGAIIIIEGHSDPLQYLTRKKQGAIEVELKRIEQAAKNLSLARAISVRDSIVDHAKGKHLSLDPSQFTVIGHGIRSPKSGLCGGEPCAPKTQDEWLSNMRVTFRIIQVEAETSVFTPLK